MRRHVEQFTRTLIPSSLVAGESCRKRPVPKQRSGILDGMCVVKMKYEVASSFRGSTYRNGKDVIRGVCLELLVAHDGGRSRSQSQSQMTR